MWSRIKNNRFYNFAVNNWYFRRTIRVVRTAVIGIGIFQLGSTHGVIEHARNPTELEESVKKNLLESNNATKIYSKYDNPECHRVITVADRALRWTYKYSVKMVKELEHALETANNLKAEESDIKELEEKKKFWVDARQRMHGEWDIVFNNSPLVNAFVSDMCPRRIFINEGLIVATECNDDELAMIVFHEISHYLKGHGYEKAQVSAFLQILELTLLSIIDPIGLSSLFYAWGLNVSMNMFAMGHSQDSETEADELGLDIMLTSDFNPISGIEIMRKFAILDNETHRHALEDQAKSEPKIVHEPQVLQKLEELEELGTSNMDIFSMASKWSSTHPPSIDRYRKLRATVEQHLEEIVRKEEAKKVKRVRWF